MEKIIKGIGFGLICAIILMSGDTQGGVGNKGVLPQPNPLRSLFPFPYIPDMTANPSGTNLKNMFKKTPGHLPMVKDIPHKSPTPRVPVIVHLREFPFLKHVVSQNVPGKGLPKDIRKMVATKMGQDYVAKLTREHERVINQIWEMEKELAASKGEDPSLVEKPPLKKEFFYASNGFATDMHPELMRKVERLGSVLSTELDTIVQAHLFETVPFTGARAVHNSTPPVTGLGVNIAVADTGIAWDHKDFGVGGNNGCKGPGCKVVKARNWASYDPVTCPQGEGGYDCMEHGSHVAGIAAANRRTIGAYDYSGIAPDATLIALRILDENGQGSISDVETAVNWSAGGCANPLEPEPKVCPDILNLSLGGSCKSEDGVHCDDNDGLSSAIETATNIGGVLVVASAGNNGDMDQYFKVIQTPAFAHDALTVGATRKTDDLLSSYTANGPAPICIVASGPGTPDCDPSCAPNCTKADCDTICDPSDAISWGLKPDMLSPGGRGGSANPDESICSTKIQNAKIGMKDCMDTEHTFLAGTSMAAPHAAGAAALLLQKYPSIKNDFFQRAKYAKGMLLQSGVLTLPGIISLFQDGGGRGKFDDSTLDGVVIMPYSLNLGQASFGPTGDWSTQQALEVRNYTAGQITVSLSSSDNIDYRAPGALTVGMPASINVPAKDPNTGAPGVATFTATFTLLRTAPNPPEPRIGFEGYIRAVWGGSGTPRSIHVPFFIRSPKLSPCATITPAPDFVLIHDREDFVIQIPPADPQALSLMEGTYDIIVAWMPTDTDPYPSIVFREQQHVDSTTCFTISKSEAVNVITLNPLDKNNQPLFPAGGYFLAAYPVVGGVQKLKTAFYLPIPIPGIYSTLKVSNVSTVYNFDALGGGENNGVLYGVSGRRNGISGSETITVGGSGAGYYNFTLAPDADQVEPGFLVQPAFGNPSIPNYLYPPFGPLAGLIPIGFPMPDDRLPAYIMPMGDDFFWKEGEIRLAYSRQFCITICLFPGVCFNLCFTFNIPQNWSPFYRFDSVSQAHAYIAGETQPAMELASSSEIPIALAPLHFFGKFTNEPQRAVLSPSLGAVRWFTNFQMLDFAQVWQPYELRDGSGNLIREGNLYDPYETSPSLEERMFLPSAGQYNFSTSYQGALRIYGYNGQESTAISFNTTRSDPNPPTLRGFFVLKDAPPGLPPGSSLLYHSSWGKPTEVVTSRSGNAIAFTAFEDQGQMNSQITLSPRYDPPFGLTPSFAPGAFGKIGWAPLPNLTVTQLVDALLRIGESGAADQPYGYIENFAPGYVYVKSPLAYVGNLGSNDISVVDPLTGQIKWTSPIGLANSSVALGRTGTKLYISHPGAGTVGVLDAATRQLLTTVPVSGTNPEGIAVSPDDKVIIVANSASTSISVIGQASPFDIGGYSTDAAINSAGTKAYVPNIKLDGSRALSVIDIAARTYQDIVLPATIGGAQTFPMEVALHPDGVRAYVTAWPNAVFVVNLDTNTVQNTITVGARPQGISVLPDGSKVYVANSDSSTVSVIRADTDTVTKVLQCFLGTHLAGMDSTYDSRYVLVTGSYSNTLAVIDTWYDEPIRLISLSPGVYPIGVSVY